MEPDSSDRPVNGAYTRPEFRERVRLRDKTTDSLTLQTSVLCVVMVGVLLGVAMLWFQDSPWFFPQEDDDESFGRVAVRLIIDVLGILLVTAGSRVIALSILRRRMRRFPQYPSCRFLFRLPMGQGQVYDSAKEVLATGRCTHCGAVIIRE